MSMNNGAEELTLSRESLEVVESPDPGEGEIEEVVSLLNEDPLEFAGKLD